MRTLLIDGDVIAYQFACASEVSINWGDDFWTLHADAKVAKTQMTESLEILKENLNADTIVIALSDSSREYFRKEILPTYKDNRSKVRKPIILKELRQFLRDNYKFYEKEALEGDDVLGILATHPKLVPGEKIVVSIDKDLLTIPGLHYNTRHPENGVVQVSEDLADYYHLFQTLTGDSSDGFSGCPGIGAKRAEQILAMADGDKSQLWPCVVKAFEDAGFGKEEALRQARVARILRADEYDYKIGQPILWKPITAGATL